jgi:hypothetical protein
MTDKYVISTFIQDGIPGIFIINYNHCLVKLKIYVVGVLLPKLFKEQV